MDLATFSQESLPLIERAIRDALEHGRRAETQPLHEMMVYQLGLDREAETGLTRGKRIRPLLVLLACGSASPESQGWRPALPAAAAVELLHNFSLIHDDIEDNSPIRRGRPSVWKRWGIPQAINAGDAMYTLAYRALLDLRDVCGSEIALQAQAVLQETCLALTRGQYLDLDFETRSEVSLAEYWSMIEGKTAALLAACTELGALAARAPEERRRSYREFGRSLGSAFQAQDDLLGIWGNEKRTGKSVGGDLVSGKKSLPILFGLSQNGQFAGRWRAGPVPPEAAGEFAALLEREGARTFTEEQVRIKTGEAMHHLEAAAPEGEVGAMLAELANRLLDRQI
ncbi:MAG TPA: polyprenyl synthetase family protein [Anaerolineales bacterium]|nr:polyprenyl synthetase family protein [Anaerolineales bacterium]